MIGPVSSAPNPWTLPAGLVPPCDRTPPSPRDVYTIPTVPHADRLQMERVYDPQQGTATIEERLNEMNTRHFGDAPKPAPPRPPSTYWKVDKWTTFQLARWGIRGSGTSRSAPSPSDHLRTAPRVAVKDLAYLNGIRDGRGGWPESPLIIDIEDTALIERVRWYSMRVDAAIATIAMMVHGDDIPDGGLSYERCVTDPHEHGVMVMEMARATPPDMFGRAFPSFPLPDDMLVPTVLVKGVENAVRSTEAMPPALRTAPALYAIPAVAHIVDWSAVAAVLDSIRHGEVVLDECRDPMVVSNTAKARHNRSIEIVRDLLISAVWIHRHQLEATL